LALRLLAQQEPPPELLRALNRSLVGPFRWAGLEAKRERLALLRERFECEFCGRFLEWFQNAKAREIAEGAMSNAEKIALLRQELFADVDELEKSGEIVLPD
jgi:urocanate hydratase